MFRGAYEKVHCSICSINKYQCLPATLSSFNTLAHWVFEFDPGAPARNPCPIEMHQQSDNQSRNDGRPASFFLNQSCSFCAWDSRVAVLSFLFVSFVLWSWVLSISSDPEYKDSKIRLVMAGCRWRWLFCPILSLPRFLCACFFFPVFLFYYAR